VEVEKLPTTAPQSLTDLAALSVSPGWVMVENM
jgi:hypothetical protein